MERTTINESYLLKILNEDNRVEVERVMKTNYIPQRGEIVRITPYKGFDIPEEVKKHREKTKLNEIYGTIQFHTTYTGDYEVVRVIRLCEVTKMTPGQYGRSYQTMKKDVPFPNSGEEMLSVESLIEVEVKKV